MVIARSSLMLLLLSLCKNIKIIDHCSKSVKGINTKHSIITYHDITVKALVLELCPLLIKNFKCNDGHMDKNFSFQLSIT